MTMPRPIAALCAALALAVLVLAAPLAGVAASEEADPSQQVHRIVFPVIGDVSYTDTYDAPRSGDRIHHATDLMGPKMLELVAASDGTITFITIPEASYGYMLRITADDGWVYSYVHINNDTPGTDDGQADLSDVFGPGIREGARVTAGQLVGYLGDSGNAEATAPHLHFEMKDPAGNQVNPYESLNQATRLQQPTAADSSEAAIADSPIPRLAGPSRVETAIEASRHGWPSGAAHVVIASGAHYAEALPASVLAAQRGAPLLLVTSKGVTSGLASEIDRLGAAGATVVGSVPSTVESSLSQRGLSVTRVGTAGSPKDTAVAVAKRLGGDAGVAVLVNGDTFADGVSGAALAAGRGWPILLSSQSYVYQESVDVWRALGVHTIYLVGGPAVLGDNIRAWMQDQGLKAPRLSGSNRYGTSAAVASAVERLGGRSPASLLFATGRNYPDALASGALAARLGAHVALVDGAGVGGDRTVAEWVKAHAGSVDSPRILGGPVAVGGTADGKIQSWLGY